MMSEKRFEYDKCTGIKDLSIDEDDDQFLYPTQIVDLLNELNNENKELKEENEQLRLELETHKHPLWSTREAERKLSEVTNNLANEVKKNGLLNEEINQLRIENMILKKKGGDEMSEKRFRAEVDAKGHLKIITDGETVLNDSYEVVDLLNEQQATIERLERKLELKTEEVEYLKRMIVKWGMVKDE